jgi:hypothetical protein
VPVPYIFIAMALEHSLKLGIVTPVALLLSKNLPWLFVVFYVSKIFRIDSSNSVINVIGILEGTVLNMYIAFAIIAIFTMIILPIHEYWRSFHLPYSSSISFFSGL